MNIYAGSGSDHAAGETVRQPFESFGQVTSARIMEKAQVSLFTGGIHKKVGPLLIKQINPGGEHGRGCSHVANQDRKGKRSDQKSHD